jgi:hypothetical protein
MGSDVSSLTVGVQAINRKVISSAPTIDMLLALDIPLIYQYNLTAIDHYNSKLLLTDPEQNNRALSGLLLSTRGAFLDFLFKLFVRLQRLK